MEISNKALGVVGVVAALAGGMWVGSTVLSKNSAMEPVESAESSRMSALEDQLARLSQQIDNLGTANQASSQPADDGMNDRMAQLTAMIEELSEKQDELADSLEEEEDLPEEPQLSYREQLANAVEQQKKQKEHMQTTFENQEIDDVWSTSVTTHVEEIFQKPELAAGKLASADCRSTMCKIEILHEPQSKEQDLFMFENHLLMELAQDLPVGMVERVHGEDGMRTVAYFARRGHALPQHQDDDVNQ